MPVETVLVMAFPEIEPNRAEDMTPTLAGPPLGQQGESAH